MLFQRVVRIEQELQDMFWGDYYGSCADKFGVKWNVQLTVAEKSVNDTCLLYMTFQSKQP